MSMQMAAAVPVLMAAAAALVRKEAAARAARAVPSLPHPQMAQPVDAAIRCVCANVCERCVCV